MVDRDFKGIWIPKEIWLDKRLTILDKAILVEIDSLSKNDCGCFASNKHFSEMFGCTERQASASISKMTKMGFVEITGFDGRKRSMRSCLANIAEQTGNIREARTDGEADTNNPSGCITETSTLPDENFQSGSRNLLHSKSISNAERNTDIIPSKNIIINNKQECTDYQAGLDDEVMDNPFGCETGFRPRFDTVQVYAANELSPFGCRAQEELQSFVDDTSEEVVRHAIDNALDNGVRKWAYVKAILNEYVDNHVKTVGDAKQLDEKHKRRKKGGVSDGAERFSDDKEFCDRVFTSEF